MKDIYLLLTKSDTFISKAIYLMTQDSYTHISISFEENLQPMYSCARKYTYSPIPAPPPMMPMAPASAAEKPNTAYAKMSLFLCMI